mgnify:CR=1 FL=1
MYKRCCLVTDSNREISGKLHTKIQRSDGFCFFLDQAFVTLLENINSETVTDKIVSLGAEHHEISTMIKLLLDYELLQKEEDEDTDE